ncbi:hypothetical protein WQ54_21710 [Bacillus sp. SA1-12]|uniref:hypothetical protein n=1 Tax=Bacillus sp. SA1-12 TaxID=1455638 RepID=UPI000627333D|nr:hypothetical protein [Bacillus sp. SA1-12]KKI90548.1 hypothetical protein WQ54_21710 [Bacillus sp. SA1-12]
MDFMKYEGEWYVWTIVLTSILFVLIMPKKNLTWAGIFMTIFLSGGLTWISDSIAGSVIDLFDLAKKQTTELSDAFLISFVPASIATSFVNFYKPQKKWMFAISFTVLCTVLETGLVLFGYMKNNDWRTWYGLPVYFIVFRFFFPWYLQLLTKKLVKY